MFAEWDKIARIRTDRHSRVCNGGWGYDSYPELEPLKANKSIVIAEIKGPAVITCIHVTQHFYMLQCEDRKAVAARGVIMEIYFNDVPKPAVRVPLGDFFADGCAGRAEHFSSLYVEKAPESYNCFIPMPFEKSARIVLKNETPYDMSSYSFVEYEELPEWDKSLGYFHATWSRFAFQLTGNTNLPFFHVDGTGHILGRAWSICTDEPLFGSFHFVMEGNNEVRIDEDEKPTIDYLGTEDSFGFSWGFNKVHSGPYNGMNYVTGGVPSLLSIYRFYGANVIRFNKSLDWRINWSNEWTGNDDFQEEISRINNMGRGWIDYAATYYWYQDTVGFEHQPMPSLEERCRLLLVSNSGN